MHPHCWGLSHLRSASHLWPCAACNRGSAIVSAMIDKHDLRSRRPGPSTRPTPSWIVVLLNALSFASLAYVANRKGQHTMAALLAAGAWLFVVTRRADLGLALMSRRFPPPWSVEENEARFIVRDERARASPIATSSEQRAPSATMRAPRSSSRRPRARVPEPNCPAPAAHWDR